MKKISASIIGAASISAAFLMKFIARHKNVELKHAYSSSQAGTPVSSYHSFLTGIVDMEFETLDVKDMMFDDSDVVFIARPHGKFLDQSALMIKGAIHKKLGTKFIDLSADFRLKDVSVYEHWYSVRHHHEDLLETAVYGLPELYCDEIKDATLVANPGCYPTCAILSLAPFIANNIKHDGIFINALSGVSGAGIRPSAKNIAMNVSENIFAYKVGGAHQHTPEIEQELSNFSSSVKVTFTPHVAPFKYGIIQTTCVKLLEKVSASELRKIYEEFYKDSRFVNIIAAPDLPEVKDVVGTNFANIGIKVDNRTNTLVLVSCIDNVIKGAAGQAVQNMNIMYRFDEDEGLR